jgi:hypothetical protein
MMERPPRGTNLPATKSAVRLPRHSPNNDWVDADHNNLPAHLEAITRIGTLRLRDRPHAGYVFGCEGQGVSAHAGRADV